MTAQPAEPTWPGWSPPPDRRARSAVLIAATMSGLYGGGLLAEFLVPKSDRSGPLNGLFLADIPHYAVAAMFCVLASWVIAPVVLLIAHAARNTRTGLAVATGVLLVPFGVLAMGTVITLATPAVALALPSTAFAFWLVQRMQRYHRMPVWLGAFTLGWAALPGAGFGGAMDDWITSIATNLLTRSEITSQQANNLPQYLPTVMHQIHVAAFAAAGTFEEAGKLAGVAVVYLCWRRHLDGVVSGVILGACAGLGLNLVETVEYMGRLGGLGAAYQYWARQSVGLMAAHVAFTAVGGAGFGIAANLTRRRERALAIGCGWVAASGGHFFSDVALSWFGELTADWSVSPLVTTVVVTPAEIALTSGLFVILYLLLRRQGVRAEGQALWAALQAEAAAGYGAITATEAALLMDPKRRLQRQLIVLRLAGTTPWRELARLHRAQFDLVTLRGRLARGRVDPGAPTEWSLRARVLARKYGVPPEPVDQRPSRAAVPL